MEPSLETGTALHCPKSENIVALVGLGVCDGAHRLVVMKRSGVRLRKLRCPRHPTSRKARDVGHPAPGNINEPAQAELERGTLRIFK